jgi:hypothetical protein
VLGTQETFCIVIAGLFERDSFNLFLPEFDKPWVIHLRKTYCCSTNLCTWRPNTVYKNRRLCRHQWTMYFDGSKRVQGAGAGVVLISSQGDKLKYVLRMSFPQASNNEAEYEALLHGMKMTKACEATRLKIFGD